MIISILIKRIHLPTMFIGLSVHFFMTVKSLFRTHGYISTLLVLNRINREIKNRGNINNLINYPGLNPIIVNTLSSILLPPGSSCLRYSDKINKKFIWYVLGMIISNCNNIIVTVIKFFIGLILSSLGILYSEIFSGYPNL
uniref:hypothetical protein n=1 Tax=Daedaleopsis nitida TaxID=1140402 RepID=UPI0030E0F685